MKAVTALEVIEKKDRLDEKKPGEDLLHLWEVAICLLAAQQHTYYYFTYGMKNIKGKPRKKWLRQCRFSIGIPEPVIVTLDNGEYFQIHLKFKVKGKTFVPYALNTAFFISSRAEPLTFYLLGSYRDYQLVSYFSNKNFKMSVLKAHFTDRLKQLFSGSSG